MKKREAGYVLPAIVLALTLLLIIIPGLIRIVQKDSQDAQAINKKTIAFQLAEAGQDRGAWKLRESDAMWSDASGGTDISGYNDDTVYTDVQGGQYKINFNAGPGPGEVTVISKGLANGTLETRSIKGVYSKGTVAGALSVVGGLSWKPNLIVEWGPVVAYGNITTAPTRNWPRIYAVGSIKDWDENPDAPNGAMPGENWTAYSYASYYALGNAPTVKLNDYRTLAKNTCLPALDAPTGPGAAAHWAGPGGCPDSGYYTANVNIAPDGPGNYIQRCSTCVIFVEGEVKSFPNNAYLDIRALLATGDIDFNAKNTTYIATVPASAHDEYQHANGEAHWTAMGWNEGANYTIANVGMHGFLYGGGDLKNAGGNTIIVGSIFIGGSLTVNTTTVYYDSEVADGVLYEASTISRRSWDETREAW